jgi:hypothetical protein
MILILSWGKILDGKAHESNLETTKDVAVYMATTRGINAILSVFEETTISLGIGAGIELSVGKIVNPINDFLDRVSWILLFSLISLGIQKLILTLVETNIINLLLSLSIFTLIFGQIYSKINRNIFNINIKILIFLIFVRFAVPLMELTNAYIYDKVMKAQVEVIQSKMEKVEQDLEKIVSDIDIASSQIKNTSENNNIEEVNQTTQTVINKDIQQKIDQLESKITILKTEKSNILKVSIDENNTQKVVEDGTLVNNSYVKGASDLIANNIGSEALSFFNNVVKETENLAKKAEETYKEQVKDAKILLSEKTSTISTEDQVKLDNINKEILQLENQIEKLSPSLMTQLSNGTTELISNAKNSLPSAINEFKDIISGSFISKKVEEFKQYVKVKIAQIDQITDIYFEQTYTLIVMFIVRAVLFPILFLWIFVRGFDTLFRVDYSKKMYEVYQDKIKVE